MKIVASDLPDAGGSLRSADGFLHVRAWPPVSRGTVMNSGLRSGSDPYAVLRAAGRLVLKLGTTSVVDSDNRVRDDSLGVLVGEVAERVRAGTKIAVVSSGAIALGADRLGVPRPGGTDLAGQRLCSMAGQPILAAAYLRLFADHGLVAVFCSLTGADFRREAGVQAREGLAAAINHEGVVPVINNNDLTNIGAMYGDNDHLAVDVAVGLGAEAVVLGSDHAVHAQDPRTNPAAPRIPVIRGLTDLIDVSAGRPTGRQGTGGMASKLHAALEAQRNSVLAVITRTDLITAVLRGGDECTYFPV